MAGIVVDGVRRSFGSVNAVQDATFTARPGAVTGLVGPNGAGKTTLLLMLASLLAPDAGTITLDGSDPIAHPAEARPKLGWMPDTLGSWPALTGRETLVATARLYDISHDDAKARASSLLGLVGLNDLGDRPTRVLSRGQKQKLALARALVHGPQVLLLDEPASGLDPRARIELRQLLRALAGEGVTILVSSHVLSELEEMIDDAVFMVDGRTVTRPTDVAGRQWKFRLLTPLPVQDVSNALGASVDVDRDAYVVSFADEGAASAGLAQLIRSGFAVTEFAPHVSRLESEFLALEQPKNPGGAQ